MTLSGANTLSQSGPGSDSNEGVLRIPQSSSITGTSPSDCLVSYPGHLLGEGSYLSAEVQLVYSTAPANWAKNSLEKSLHSIIDSDYLLNHWRNACKKSWGNTILLQDIVFIWKHGNRFLVWGQLLGWLSLKAGHRVWMKLSIYPRETCNWYHGLRTETPTTR